MSVKFGPHLSTFKRFWPDLVRLRPIFDPESFNIWRCRPNDDQIWPNVGRTWPLSTEIDLILAKCCLDSSTFRHVRPDLGQIWSDLGLSELDLIWSNFGKFWPESGHFLRSRPGLGQSSKRESSSTKTLKSLRGGRCQCSISTQCRHKFGTNSTQIRPRR